MKPTSHSCDRGEVLGSYKLVAPQSFAAIAVVKSSRRTAAFHRMAKAYAEAAVESLFWLGASFVAVASGLVAMTTAATRKDSLFAPCAPPAPRGRGARV